MASCPNCGNEAGTSANVCSTCSGLTNGMNPNDPRLKKKHSVTYWIFVYVAVTIGMTVAIALLLQAMVHGL